MCAEALVTVNIGGTNYSITTFEGSYNSNSIKFATPANNGLMPWWGNETLARSFSDTVGNALGTPNGPGTGPFFAYQRVQESPGQFRVDAALEFGFTALDAGQSGVYAALAPALPPAVPGPLPLLGAAAAFGMSRRLRRRIQQGD